MVPIIYSILEHIQNFDWADIYLLKYFHSVILNMRLFLGIWFLYFK